MKTKTILCLCLVMGISPVAFIGLYHWDFAQNRGFRFGYFGAFNRVRHALAEIPGVTIIRDWANNDVTLEEFGFYLTIGTGQSLHLAFQESDPLRKLSGQQLTAALLGRIQQEMPSMNPRE